MMSRSSRLLKWMVSATVLLAAAPIAYADGAAKSGTSPPDQRSALCGGGPADFAGTYIVAGLTEAAYNFDLATMKVTPLYFGMPALTGVWEADGGQIGWTINGLVYSSKPGTVTCSITAAAGQVTQFTATATDGSDTVTLLRQ